MRSRRSFDGEVDLLRAEYLRENISAWSLYGINFGLCSTFSSSIKVALSPICFMRGDFEHYFKKKSIVPFPIGHFLFHFYYVVITLKS